MGSLYQDGFYDAKTAREMAIGTRATQSNIVLPEINFLQVAVDNAAGTGNLEVTVANSTTMTQGLVYYETWNNFQNFQDDAHFVANTRMNAVINYFSRLGYIIKREREGVADRMQWKIRW